MLCGANVEARADAVGQIAPDILLTAPSGEQKILGDYRDARAIVVVFLGTECPIGNKYIPILNQMRQGLGEKYVHLVAVNANRGDSLEEIKEHIDEYDIQFDVLRDDYGRLARALGAERLCTAYLLDAQMTVRYQGRIDDRYGYTYNRDEPNHTELLDAVHEVLEHETVSTDVTEVQGCVITPPEDKVVAPEDVNYAEHVATIFQNKCQNCHHPGTAAPFELATYDDAINWAGMIREVVEQRRMPPWHADPRHGHFSNDRRLSEQEIATVLAWLDADAPLGPEDKLPPPKEYPHGWTIGEPDIVFEMPESVEVPATGVVPYKYFVSETGFEEDVYISAAEAIPGDRSVVHHIIAFYVPPGERLGQDAGLDGQWIVGTAPGDMPLVLPEGVALKVPAGSKIIWQMHYTPTGKAAVDRSKIGVVKYKGKEPPKHVVNMVAPAQVRLRIPGGEHHHHVAAKPLEVTSDAYLLSFMPHMHLRGKVFRYELEYPDGKRETLLNVPRYDFNWQTTYRLDEPRLLPAGSKLHCTAYFDNSTDNPANPDPNATVHWGDQTWEEMMIGYVNYYLADEDAGEDDLLSYQIR